MYTPKRSCNTPGQLQFSLSECTSSASHVASQPGIPARGAAFWAQTGTGLSARLHWMGMGWFQPEFTSDPYVWQLHNLPTLTRTPAFSPAPTLCTAHLALRCTRVELLWPSAHRPYASPAVPDPCAPPLGGTILPVAWLSATCTRSPVGAQKHRQCAASRICRCA